MELSDLLDPALLGQYLPFLAVFAAVALTVFGVGSLLVTGDPLRRRLGAGRTDGASRVKAAAPQRPGIIHRVLSPLQGLAPVDAKSRSLIARQLIQAGFLGSHAVGTFFAARLILALSLPLLFSIVSPFLSRSMAANQVLMLAGGLGLFGYLLPSLVVQHRTAKRQLAAREGFPDALDLLLVCVEAGLGLDAAIARVGDEIGKAHPLLGQQFHLMALELRAGKTRADALRNFSERIGIDEISSFSSLLVQTEALGTSMADSLRAHADDMRARRLLRAEEKAQQLGVKMTFPLIMFILPTLIIFIMAPAIIQVKNNLLPVLGGGD